MRRLRALSMAAAAVLTCSILVTTPANAKPAASAVSRQVDRTIKVTLDPPGADGTSSLAIRAVPGRGDVTVRISVDGPVSTTSALTLTRAVDQAGKVRVDIPVAVGTGQHVGYLRALVTQSGGASGRSSEGNDTVWLARADDGALVSSKTSSIDVETSRALHDAHGDQSLKKAKLHDLEKARSVDITSKAVTSVAVPADKIEFTGQVTYEDRDGTRHPARDISVQVTLQPSGSPNTVRTDDNGRYTLHYGVPPGSTWFGDITFITEGPLARVEAKTFPTDITYRSTTSFQNFAGGTSHTIDFNAANNGGPRNLAFAVYDSAITAERFAQMLRGSALPQAEINFPVGTRTDTLYNAIFEAVDLGDWDWSDVDVIGHELGHYLSDKADTHNILVWGDHCDNSNLTEHTCGADGGLGKGDGTQLAWSEAWATFLSLAGQFEVAGPTLPDGRDHTYNDRPIDTNNQTVSGARAAATDVDRPASDPDTAQHHGEDNEAAIARTLWDIYDYGSRDADGDLIAMDISTIWSSVVAAHPVRLSGAVAGILNGMTPTQNRGVGCALGQQRIAPYWGNDANPTTVTDRSVTLSAPPPFSWSPGNGDQAFHNGSFQVQALDSTGAVYFTSATLTQPSWTPTGQQWSQIMYGRATTELRVIGWQSNDPATGPYPGCPQTLRVDASKALVNDPACATNTIPPNDDGTSTVVDLPFPVNFFGTTRTYLWVNNNGNVTFDAPMSTYTPFPLSGSSPPLIAPFFADVDTRSSGSAPVTYSYGATTFDGRPAFCVNWINVGYYNSHADKLNSFQLLLVDRSTRGAGDFDIVFNYGDISWETGDASGGSGGLGGTPALAGYSNGAGTFLQLPGSIQPGALINGGPQALTSHNIGAPNTSGRYVFPVQGGAPPSGGSTIAGYVGTDVPGILHPVSDAPVQVCPASGGQCAFVTRSDNAGAFSAVGLAGGTYDVTAFPPTGMLASPVTQRVTVPSGGTMLVDLIMAPIAGPGTGSSIEPVIGNTGTVPVTNWNDALTLTTTACTGGTATYTITVNGTTRTGSMSESGSGHYTATVPAFYPLHGYAQVTMTVHCPDGTTSTSGFEFYIDPSGVVVDAAGNPITGATVTLLRSDALDGVFTAVADGSDLMSPANRQNPMVTGENGLFGWDVVAGYYKVRAEKTGCTGPGGAAYAETAVLTIPPPVTDLRLVLTCNRPPVVTATAVTVEGNTTNGYSGAIPGVTTSDPDGDPVTLASNAPQVLPLGVTQVHWTASDPSGASATTDQAVTVADTTAPTITCPSAVSGTSTTPALGTATATDIVDATVTVTNNAPATFPIGTTTVTWRAVDDSNNARICTQSVTVTAQPLYQFTGFFVNGANVGTYTTCTASADVLCGFVLSWQLKDNAGRYVTSLSAVTSYSWNVSGATFGTLTYNSTTHQYQIPTNLGSPPTGLYTVTVTFADGTKKAMKAQLTNTGGGCEAC